VTDDPPLADRVRELLWLDPEVTEKRMFGGVSFLIGGHIAVAVSGRGGLLMRIGPEGIDATLRGWVRVDEGAVSTEEDLRRWVRRGTGLARALPPKE
jgi:TfoX/Sxy family transcriptional regulator of competence genes